MTLVEENARYVGLQTIPDGTGRLICHLSRSSIGMADVMPHAALFPQKVFILLVRRRPDLTALLIN